MSLMPAPEWHLLRREHGALAWRVWPGPDRLHMPALIWWTSEGNSARQVVAETAP